MPRGTLVLRLAVGAAAIAACAALAYRHHQRAARRLVQAADVAGEASPAATFPLRVAPGGRYLVDRGGRPFLLCGDAAWSLLAGLTNEQAAIYLDDRRRRGFNAILVSLIEHDFAAHAPRNAYGEPPFLAPGDFRGPNEEYFAHADAVLRMAEARGMAVLLTPDYLGQDGKGGWYFETLRAGRDAIRAYGAYVGRRYRAFENVTWVLGGDYTPPPQGMALVDALAEGLRSADGGAHLFTAHFSAETSAQDAATTPIDLNTTYTYKSVYARSLADHQRPGALPHILIESAYELEHDSTPRSLRTQAYDALLTGAAGQVFGNGAIWGFFRAWPANLDTDGARSMTDLRALFEPLAWQTLAPDAAGGVLAAGTSAPGDRDRDRVLLARSPDGRLAVAYDPAGVPLTLELERLATPLRARWYDPTAGTYVPADGSPFREPRPVTFRPPGTNRAGDPDWALVLEATAE
jgi:Protein of unknown function (DUF4038)/Putative collagen-binding domain of a collagenase